MLPSSIASTIILRVISGSGCIFISVVLQQCSHDCNNLTSCVDTFQCRKLVDTPNVSTESVVKREQRFTVHVAKALNITGCFFTSFQS